MGRMIEKYLTSRKELKGVISLVDARHDPTDDDISMYQYLRYYDIPVLVVATKSDKIARGKWNQHESRIKKSLILISKTRFKCFLRKLSLARTQFGNGLKIGWVIRNGI